MKIPGLGGLATVAMFLAAPVQALAEDLVSVPAPRLRAGDTWILSRTEARGQSGFTQRTVVNKVERVSGDTMVLGSKTEGASTDFVDHLIGTDFSVRRHLNGQETLNSKPFDFPMTTGKTWIVDFTEQPITGPVTSNHTHGVYKVDGWEDVVTPAGKFRALKIEENGTLEVQVAATTGAVGGTQSTVSSATAVSQATQIPAHTEHLIEYQELYYAPEVKHYVKSIYEQYNGANVRIGRDTETLVLFTPAP